MTTTQVVDKARSALVASALAAKDNGIKMWKYKRHNSVVAIVMSKALAAGWQPTPEDCFEFVQATYNVSAWTKKFQADGIFPKGKSPEDNDIAELLAEGIAE